MLLLYSGLAQARPELNIVYAGPIGCEQKQNEARWHYSHNGTSASIIIVYVPTETKTIKVNLPRIDDKIDIAKTKFHTNLFGGDQLTSKRAWDSQMIRSNSVTSTEQINGSLPCSGMQDYVY